jgi:predicted methyltransferase
LYPKTPLSNYIGKWLPADLMPSSSASSSSSSSAAAAASFADYMTQNFPTFPPTLPDHPHALTIVDACAGGGGKTLAIADALLGKGRVYSYDVMESKVRSTATGLASSSCL